MTDVCRMVAHVVLVRCAVVYMEMNVWRFEPLSTPELKQPAAVDLQRVLSFKQ